eukprot:TRINITY_DN6968_c0_g1_i1.p1 TRINITY_DN6968_c0_g1~~TRINITY_DN6968_c0_g1_i1.p1  ORF type:complete len:425 (-),score=87.65 TRINITY_DN6968_c0_g1_i1:111-1385(-)
MKRTTKKVPEEVPEYEVERILDKRVTKAGTQYLLKWKGFKVSEATWEPESFLTNTDHLLAEYLARITEAPRGKRKASVSTNDEAPQKATSRKSPRTTGTATKRKRVSSVKKTNRTKKTKLDKDYESESEPEESSYSSEEVEALSSSDDIVIIERKKPVEKSAPAPKKNVRARTKRTSSSSEIEYEAEKIVDCRVGDEGQHLYLVKWVGFSDDACTWQPISDLENCPELLQQFIDNDPKAKKLKHDIPQKVVPKTTKRAPRKKTPASRSKSRSKSGSKSGSKSRSKSKSTSTSANQGKERSRASDDESGPNCALRFTREILQSLNSGKEASSIDLDDCDSDSGSDYILADKNYSCSVKDVSESDDLSVAPRVEGENEAPEALDDCQIQEPLNLSDDECSILEVAETDDSMPVLSREGSLRLELGL